MKDALRVAVNLRTLHPDRIGGLETAFREVARRLVDAHGPDVRLTLLTSPWNSESFASWGDRIDRRMLRSNHWEQDLQVALATCDVLWCPLFFLEPVRASVPAVVMMPDLQHETYPHFFSPAVLAERIRLCRASALLSARVLTLSEHGRRQLIDAYGLPESHVVVTALDVADAFRRPPEVSRQAAIRSRYGLDRPFVLFPANSWPHKNHRGAFEALAAYRRLFGRPPLLVLTGARLGGDLTRLAAEIGVHEEVSDLGFVDPVDMPDLYDSASALFFPSLFEGFGIPLLEAFHRRVPVVASNATSMPEIAADAAVLVDPRDPSAAAHALHSVISDHAFARTLVERGALRAAAFSYDRTARVTLAALQAAASPASRTPAVVLRRPTVFIVTPSFNQGRFLRATIESVLSQDYDRIEYFVADGGSTDDSVEILRSFGDRIRWRSGPDGGQAAAIARAWKESDAEIVAWLNSDDTYLPGAVSTAVDFLGRHPEHSMVYGSAWYTDEAGNPTGRFPTKPWDRTALAGECFVCQPTVFIRREVFRVIGYPDPGLRYCMDYDLWIRLSERFAVGQVDADLATWRLYPANKTFGERAGVFREIMRVCRKHYGFVHPAWILGHAEYRAAALMSAFNFLPARLRRFVIRRLTRHVEHGFEWPVYADGWTAQRAVVAVAPDPEGRVVLHCDSPYWPFRRPLRVRVGYGDRTLAEKTVRRRGPFELRIVVPATEPSVNLLLEANRAFSPMRLGISSDSREIAFRVLAISASDPDHRARRAGTA
jgi:glycosyltransferase involved in cell wall biosynthesis